MEPFSETVTIDRGDLKNLIKEALRDALPDALRKEFELVGIDATDSEKRAQIRKDMELMRKFRLAYDGAAMKIGHGLLWFFFIGFATFALTGFKVKLPWQ